METFTPSILFFVRHPFLPHTLQSCRLGSNKAVYTLMKLCYNDHVLDSVHELRYWSSPATQWNTANIWGKRSTGVGAPLGSGEACCAVSRDRVSVFMQFVL